MPTTSAIRRRFRPAKVKVLFIGESPPAGGTFFYRADSRLYGRTRTAFARAFGRPIPEGHYFLREFRRLGCYLEDLCLEPVNRLPKAQRKVKRENSIEPLARRLVSLKPTAIVVLAKGIRRQVDSALRLADLDAVSRFELPFPAMSHEARFERELVAALRQFRRLGVLK